MLQLVNSALIGSNMYNYVALFYTYHGVGKVVGQQYLQAGKKKLYMLFELEPDRSVTGGAFYSEQEFESEFVDILTSQCHKFLQNKVSKLTSKCHKFLQNKVSALTSILSFKSNVK